VHMRTVLELIIFNTSRTLTPFTFTLVID